MSAVYMVWRAALRRRWGPALVLVVLIGLGGGVVLTTVAGASRTSTAVDRFVAYSHPEDVFVVVPSPDGGPTPENIAKQLADRAALARLPQVLEVGRAPYLLLSPDKAGQQVGAINAFASADIHGFRTIDRPRLLHGRFSRVDRPDEAVVDDVTANLQHLKLRSTVTMWSYTQDQQDTAMQGGFAQIPPPAGPRYRFRIVGIVRGADTINAAPPSIVGNALYEGQGGMVLTPAFLRQYSDDHGVPLEAEPGMEGFRIRLRHGPADVPPFLRSVAAIAPPENVHVGSDIQASAAKAKRAVRVEVVALLLFAALAGVASLLLVGQGLGRQIGADADENRTLVALGFGRRALVLVPMLRTALTAVAGAALAVGVAVALSPLMPIGLARRAEIHPGLSINVAVLAFGFLAIVAVVLLRALPPAWRASAGFEGELRQAPARPGLLTSAVGASRLGPAAAAGVGMSLERGRGIAFRASLLGTVAAVTAVIGALTFGASLDHLVKTPHEQGWNWDVVVGNPNNQQAFQGDPAADPLYRSMVAQLAANPKVGAFSGLAFGEGITVNGRPVALAGVEALKGSVHEVMLEGRPPTATDEIVLGRDPMRQLHRKVGDMVTVAAGDRHFPMRIVGVSLEPTSGGLSTRLSSGGSMTVAALRRLIPEVSELQFAVRFRPSVSTAAGTQSLLRDFGRQILLPYPGGEVGDLAKVDSLPFALAGLLVVMGIGALWLALVSSVRRHRRDLAVLKTLGFSRRQVTATVAWQATLLGAGAIVLGLPAGVIVGRLTWRTVANSVGSGSPLVVPVVALLVVVPATLAVANLLAGGPGWSAGRVHPAEALRAE